MECVRIGAGKLKLTLSDEDMKKYGVDVSALNEDTTARRRLLWTLLDEAKKKTGINTAGARTLVEAFPGRRGGCELFVTLLDGAREVHNVCYRFGSIRTARTAARRMKREEADKESAALYVIDGKEAVLALALPERGAGRLLTPYSFLEEYGKREKSLYFHAYAKEYGTCVYERDAIARLCEEEDDFSV